MQSVEADGLPARATSHGGCIPNQLDMPSHRFVPERPLSSALRALKCNEANEKYNDEVGTNLLKLMSNRRTTREPRRDDPLHKDSFSHLSEFFLCATHDLSNYENAHVGGRRESSWAPEARVDYRIHVSMSNLGLGLGFGLVRSRVVFFR